MPKMNPNEMVANATIFHQLAYGFALGVQGLLVTKFFVSATRKSCVRRLAQHDAQKLGGFVPDLYSFHDLDILARNDQETP